MALLIISFPQSKSYENEEYALTGLTVYNVYPFKNYNSYDINTIFIDNNSFSDIVLDSQWTTPFSFNNTMKTMILEIINNISKVNKDSIHSYEKNSSSLNEFIYFRLKNDNYYCIIFPSMIIGVGKLTDVGEYINFNEMYNRRTEFLSYFTEFIFETKNLKFYFQQDEFLSDEPLPRESMVWTHILRTDPNFNYLTNQQLFELQFYRTYDFSINRSSDYSKLFLSNNIHSNYFNDIILIDGYNIEGGKVFYKYPLGRNNNIIKLQMISEFNYVVLPFIEHKLKDIQESLDYIESDLISLDFKIKTKKADLNDLKNSDLFTQLLYYNDYLNDLERLDINSLYENSEDTIIDLFKKNIDTKYQQISESLDDTIKYRDYLDQYYNNLLDSAYTESTIELQLLAILIAVIGIIIAFIGSIIGPIIYNWYDYAYSTADFKVHFKNALGKSFEDEETKRIRLITDREQLIWIMIHNNGKVIRDNWFCIFYFEKNFKILPLENTFYKNVDYKKKYTIQKKYNAAHFNSMDFSPLFPHNETFIFPIVLKPIQEEGEFNVTIDVFTGNHKNKFTQKLKIDVKNPDKNEIRNLTKINGINSKNISDFFQRGFTSIDKFRNASVEELFTVISVYEKIAIDIKTQLKKIKK